MTAVPRHEPQGSALASVVNQPKSPAPISETVSASVAAKARAIVEAQYLVAMRMPRNWDTVRLKLLDACKRPGFAQGARYSKPVGGGQRAEGPSIRFAEEAARQMGNVRNDQAVVYEDEEQRIIEVSAVDLESNTPWSQTVTIKKTVERRQVRDGQTVIGQRTTSLGNTVFLVQATEDELLNKQNALCSKAARNNILRILPSDIQEECMAAVAETLEAEDKADPTAARKRMLDAFHGLGVLPNDIIAYLGHPIDQMTPVERKDLAAVYAAIRDGETSWQAVFEQRVQTRGTNGEHKEPTRGAAGLKQAVAAKKSATEAEAGTGEDEAARRAEELELVRQEEAEERERLARERAPT